MTRTMLAVALVLAPLAAGADAHAEPQPLDPDTPVEIVVVPGPDGTTTPGRCTQYEPLLVELAPAGGWDINRMSRYLWRESKCWPAVQSRTRDSGLAQVNRINHRYLARVLGEPVDRYTLTDPRQNIRAAAALCEYWRHAHRSCYRPWGGRA